MTGKTTDGEGPGVRAQQAMKRRWLVFQGLYAVAATALTVGLIMGRREPADGFPIFTPEAAVAGAVLLPLLTIVTMWFTFRMVDEVQRRIIIDAWAVALIVVMFGATSWLFLIGGGVVPQPSGHVALGALMGGAALAVLVAAVWLRWRRIGDFGAV